ncbi:GNAT family N-acetyltransferase [Streptomyces sp. NPDC048156]|uniref:GNAT family N-acetyltransferase n=1 Tax=Streptomyces sp. NPDC048156 TaxID=3365502 RepID=UPI00371838E5
MIRTAVPADAPALAALHLRARATYYPEGFPDDGTDWVQAWGEAIARPRSQILVSVRDGAVVGLASFRTPEGEPKDVVKLFQFHVSPDHWRQGVGSELHAACVEEWHADGFTQAWLDVHGDNQRAQAFYARQGWADEGYGDHGGSHRRMRLRLTARPGE